MDKLRCNPYPKAPLLIGFNSSKSSIPGACKKYEHKLSNPEAGLLARIHRSFYEHVVILCHILLYLILYPHGIYACLCYFLIYLSCYSVIPNRFIVDKADPNHIPLARGLRAKENGNMNMRMVNIVHVRLLIFRHRLILKII